MGLVGEAVFRSFKIHCRDLVPQRHLFYPLHVLMCFPVLLYLSPVTPWVLPDPDVGGHQKLLGSGILLSVWCGAVQSVDSGLAMGSQMPPWHNLPSRLLFMEVS